MTAAKVLSNTRAPISVRNVQRRLSENVFVEFGNLIVWRKLEPCHVKMRFEWPKLMSFKEPRFCCRTMFRDENIFSFDSSDRASYRRILRARLFRSDNVALEKLWFGLGFLARLDASGFVKSTMDPVAYTNMLEETLTPFIEDYCPNELTFQQYGAPAHTAEHVHEYFMKSALTEMD